MQGVATRRHGNDLAGALVEDRGLLGFPGAADTRDGYAIVHVGGTARGQERWLREHGRGASGGPGESTAMLLSEAWEVVIEVGQRVTLEGECSIEAVASELLPSQGYRTRATARVLRGSAASPLVLIGTGDRAPRAAAAKPVVRVQELSRATRQKLALALALAVAIAAFALFAAR